MGGGKGLGMFAGTYGSRVTGLLSGGTLVAAAAQLGTATDAGDSGKATIELTLGQAFAGAFGNILPSAQAFGSDLLGAMMNPGETIGGLSNIVVGYMHQAIGKQSEERAYADAVTMYFSNRYGSMANIKQTLLADPVGFAADMSLFLTGGSGALRSAAKAASVAGKITSAGKVAQGAAKASGILGKAGEILGKAGNAVDPLTTVEKGVMAVSPPVLGKVSPMNRKFAKKAGAAAARSKTALGLGTTQHTIDRDQK